MRKITDVIVPVFFPPYIGGTETVLKYWDSYFSKHMPNKLEIRFVVPFNLKKQYIFSEKRINHLRSVSCTKNKHVMKIIGMIFLLFYLIFSNADNIIVLSPKYIKIAYKIKKIFRKKYKITSWIHFSLSKMFLTDDDAFRAADYHLAISKGIATQLCNKNIDKKKIFTVYNPVKPTLERVENSKFPKYIYVGRLEYRKQKNLQELLRAFAIVLRQEPSAILELWGDGKDKKKLKELAIRLKIAEHVTFKGWSKNPWEKIDAATSLVMSSLFEGLPMAIMEAISRGIPVISSNIETGPSDEISDINGFLYESGNISDLAQKMLKIYKNRNIYQTDILKRSINQFYIEQYFKNVQKVLIRIGGSDE